MSSNVNKSVHFEWMFLELTQIRDECIVRIGGQSKQYGAELQEMLNLNGFISQWSVDGTTAVETDQSKMEFAPVPLEKQIKGVNQNWLITGNEKNFWNCFVCSGDLGGSKYLLSQMTKKKKKKKKKKKPTDPH